MIAHLTCYACQDTWWRDLIDQEVQAYIAEHPELKDKILAGEITDVDLGEVLCDGCEDFFADEASLAEHEDDTDGNYASWLCETCGDPAYDCGCDDWDAECARLDGEGVVDIEDEIDRKVELMELGRL